MWLCYALLFPVIAVVRFTKWGVDYVTRNPVSTGGHKYIIVVVDYFTKWEEAMPTFKADDEMEAYFMFNQIITHFGIPKNIFNDHQSHFQNSRMIYLTTVLWFRKDHSSSFYPQENGQVEAVKKTLKTILKHTINTIQSNCHIMLNPALWAYWTNVKTATGFSPFQLVHEWKQSLRLNAKFHRLR